jgi:glycosyltransferase involved in cell wall biosynthesis
MTNGTRANSAIYYVPEAFTRGRRVLGRQSAGAGFLQAYLRHGGVNPFYCHAKSLDHFGDFTAQLDLWGRNGSQATWIPYHRQDLLAEPGCLYRPDPVLGDLAWARRSQGSHLHSLCGVTHTICTTNAQAAIGDLLVAPYEPWDALICTSGAAKQACEAMLADWGSYLSERTRGKVHTPVEMPVIPLGVDCAAMDAGDSRDADRKRIRDKLGVDEDTVVVLFVGRLSHSSKAHPVPMYLALEEATRRTDAQVSLVQAGWFDSQEGRAEYQRCARQYCPSVRTHFVAGDSPEMERIWCAADIFTSLSDNVQETFGLTPIEAMAAGLPQVVSDWNGYRDTVRDGVDGFRIPTTVPPAGCGTELAHRYLMKQYPYGRYAGCTSLFTAIDIDRCVDAYAALIENTELRRRMGKAARMRARQEFDWEVIVYRYQELWTELAARRSVAERAEPRMPPLHNDPFVAFRGYATSVLSDQTELRIRTRNTEPLLRDLLRTPAANYGPLEQNLFERHCWSVCRLLLERPSTVKKLLAAVGPAESSRLLCVVAWMLKFGVISIIGNGGDDSASELPEAREGARPYGHRNV